MKHRESVLISTIYHPKPGMEDKFVFVWNRGLCNLAYEMGAHMAGLYHNEEYEEFLSASYWPSRKVAEAFLDSPKLKKITEELNKLCLVPASREMFDILREAI